MIEGYVDELNSCETLNHILMYLIWIKDIARYQCAHLLSEKVDTTNFCSLKKLVLHNFLMKKQILQWFIIKKEETVNFCSAKKRTLQSFVMKKADTANFCSQKKRTLQSLRGTLYNCVLDTTNCITDTTKLRPLQIWARAWSKRDRAHALGRWSKSHTRHK